MRMICRLTSEDAAAFQELRLRALRDVPEAFSSSYEEECDTPLSAIASRLELVETSAVFGAYADAELIGIVGCYREDAQKLRLKATVWGMYVVPNHRKAGIGRALLVEALSFSASLRGLEQVNISVNSTNRSARLLYEAVGFQAYGAERHSMLVNGTHYEEIHMVRFRQPAQ